jgi:hypothetical protein
MHYSGNYDIHYKKSNESWTGECVLEYSKIMLTFHPLAIADRKITKVPGKHWDIIFHNQKKNRPYGNESLKTNLKPNLKTGLIVANIFVKFLEEVKPNLLQISANEKHTNFWYKIIEKDWIKHERNKLHPVFLMREDNIIFVVSDRFSKYVQQTL